MAIGAERVDPEGVTAGYIRAYEGLDDEQFPGFFFGHPDLNASLKSGAWDFSCHIASRCMPLLAATSSVLDVGCGAGRMLHQAARHFDHAYGIDLHGRADLVARYGREQGIHNASYLAYDGQAFPFANSAFDLVYCIYVLTYVGTLETVSAILAETKRTLRPTGVAVIYYGARSTFANDRSSPWADRLDRVLERLPPWRKPAIEPTPVNLKNLGLPEPTMLRLCRRNGFKVVATGRSLRLCRGRRFGGQRFVVLQHASASGRQGEKTCT